ncbi:hypothetical protein GH733_015736 [Mirounga leonina]|nr:hypothetical protein GH733_015736 [Mirounga leonina]
MSKTHRGRRCQPQLPIGQIHNKFSNNNKNYSKSYTGVKILMNHLTSVVYLLIENGSNISARLKSLCSQTETLRLRRQPKYPRKSTPRRNKLDHYAIIKFPVTTESAMKKTEDNNTLVFTVDIKANTHQIKGAVTKLYDIDMAKVNNLIRPDGEKSQRHEHVSNPDHIKRSKGGKGTRTQVQRLPQLQVEKPHLKKRVDVTSSAKVGKEVFLPPAAQHSPWLCREKGGKAEEAAEVRGSISSHNTANTWRSRNDPPTKAKTDEQETGGQLGVKDTDDVG